VAHPSVRSRGEYVLRAGVGRCPVASSTSEHGLGEECFELGKDIFGLDQSQVRLYTAIGRHTVLVMAALAVCAVTAALLRDLSQPPGPVRPDQLPPPDPAMIALTIPAVKRLLAALLARNWPPGHNARWLTWRCRHQARSRWYTNAHDSSATPGSP
jgi:hypothetical protein